MRRTRSEQPWNRTFKGEGGIVKVFAFMWSFVLFFSLGTIACRIVAETNPFGVFDESGRLNDTSVRWLAVVLFVTCCVLVLRLCTKDRTTS